MGVALWLLVAVLACFVLAGLGVAREVALARIEAPRPEVGKPLPPALSNLLDGRLLATAGDRHYLVFLGSDCGSCEGAVASLGEATFSGEINARDVTVIASGRAAPALRQRLRSSGVLAVVDEDGRFGRAASVSVTPTTIVVEPGNETVQEIVVGEVVSCPRTTGVA